MEITKEKIINKLNDLNDWPLRFHKKYGLTGFLALIAVPLKIWLFYSFLNVSSNIISVWLITCILTLLLFTSFKNKWIPAGIYLFLTLLLFADVMYCSFFNRYLSINMLGSAGFIGDVTESIKEVLNPAFFLLFIDSLVVFLTLAIKKIKKIGNDDETKSNDKIFKDDFIDFVKQKEGTTKDKLLIRLKKVWHWLRKHKSPFIALLIVVILIANVTSSGYITSISNQEIYTFHINDIRKAISGSDGSNSLASFEDNYKKEKNGPLFGVAEGRNLFVIQVESFQDFVIGREYNGQELTPNLNALIKDQGSLYFDNFYQQVGSGNTSDAELAINNSIYGSLTSYTYKNHEDNYYRGLPAQLKDKGYTTSVFHAYEDKSFWNRENIYPNLGFDNFFGGLNGIENGGYNNTNYMGWGLTDDEFFSQSMEHIKTLPQPFYNFMITLSNHHPFKMQQQFQRINLLPEDRNTVVGNYLNSVAFTDEVIGNFIESLKKEGLYDNSIIAIYGDHLGLTLNDPGISESMSRLLGQDYDYENMMRVPLIINIPNLDKNINKTVSISAGQLDFLPTMAYLMGFDELDTIYLGHNALTAEEGFVAEQTYITKGSFFQDDIVYEMSRDGVFENGRAYNQKTGAKVPIDDCYEGYLKSMEVINASEYILKNDAIRKVFLEGDKPAKLEKSDDRTYPKEIQIAGTPDVKLVGTNSLEALNASYKAGHREIFVDVNWTSEVGARTAVLLKNWETLPQFYETSANTEMTIENFRALSMKNGLTSMDYYQLADWMAAHPDANIVVSADRSIDFFMKMMNEYNATVTDRIIPYVQGMVEYSGLYSGILNMEVGNYKPEQLLEFMKLNNVWAGSMSQESAEGRYKEFLKSEFTIYVYDKESNSIVKKN